MTTPTPEAIEALARVNAYLADFAAKFGSAAGFIDSTNYNQSNGLYADDVALLAAQVAAAPFIAAQAKAEALREAADALESQPDMKMNTTYAAVTQESVNWLRARAATIAGKSE